MYLTLSPNDVIHQRSWLGSIWNTCMSCGQDSFREVPSLSIISCQLTHKRSQEQLVQCTATIAGDKLVTTWLPWRATCLLTSFLGQKTCFSPRSHVVTSTYTFYMQLFMIASSHITTVNVHLFICSLKEMV